ncbi:MAG: hypothetical protein M1433_00640 [Candidatus Parvarchaeota archaeon]|nr:hypothetical protein [Candidatus Parvarchaeota archaeon]
MKGQIFTMDLVLGTIILLSVISSAYLISSTYLSATQSNLSNNDLLSQYSSAVTSFVLVNTTMPKMFYVQSSGNLPTVIDYIQSTLGEELSTPYSVSLYALENYSRTSLGVPDILIFEYNSSGFSGVNTQAYTEPILVTNVSSLCGSSCNASLLVNSTFPSLSTEVNAQACTVSTQTGEPVSGWTIQNDTPSGYCKITVGAYNSGGKPGNYLVNAYKTPGGASDGETTLYVLGIDTLLIRVQT